MSTPIAGPARADGIAVDKGAWATRLVFLVVGVAVLVAGVGYGLETDAGLVGPGLVPFAAGLVTVVASLWECVRTFLLERRSAGPDATASRIANTVEASAPEDLDNFGRSTLQRNRAVVLVFLVLAVTVVLTYVIGLLLALSLMVIALLVLIEKKRWWVGLLGGVAAFLFGYLVFGLALKVPLPTGMLGLI
ncbi:hypothetical protein GCM10009785_07880 [Brooklawnia cerclae]|uniref:DUF1468 domain-containing protein n=1 Tax=Brooklawnia cerclae TaxID=349934 RepID=A0ABX0SMV1_9ACTN|nr:tripartite tricarboxylate transporter TctB family protein [Brooklawnia cerclae]NIH58365.1 hypothetical protein [Brooklawnia cerclae]